MKIFTADCNCVPGERYAGLDLGTKEGLPRYFQDEGEAIRGFFGGRSREIKKFTYQGSHLKGRHITHVVT